MSEAIAVDLQFEEEDLEFGPAPAGEYLIEVLSAKFKEGINKNGDSWSALSLTLDLPEEETADVFYEMAWLPQPHETGKQRRKSEARWREWCSVLGIEPANFDPEQAQGAKFYANIREKEDEYGKSNAIANLIGPA